MSISSCPRCAQHVTLPAGVSQHAQVRCPLCHEQYTLADAMANAPPLLVVVEEQPADLPAEWLATAPPVEAPPTIDEPALHFTDEPHAAAALPVAEPVADSSPEIEHDDFVMQEKDTEVEDFNFAPDSLAHGAPLEGDAHGLVDHEEESVLDLGGPLEDTAAPAFDEAAHSGSGDMEIDFGEPQPMGEALAEPTAGDEMALDFGEPQEVAAEDGGIGFEFNDAQQSATADENDLVPDFGEPAAVPALPVAEAVQEDAKGKKKDKKEKKGKEAKKKSAEPKVAKPPRKRSLVGSLLMVILPLFITVPLAIYGLLWLGPSYDFFGIGKKLPTAMVPAAFNKPDTAAQAAKAQAAFSGLAQQYISGQTPLPPGIKLPGTAPETEPAATPESDAPAAAEPTAAAPAAENVAATPEAVAMPDETPAKPPAEDVAATEPEKPAAEPETPVEEPPALSAAEPAEPDAAKSEEMPDEAPEKVAAAEKSPEPAGDLDSLLAEDKPEASALDNAVETAEPLGPISAPEFTSGDLAAAMHEVSATNEKMTAAQAAKDDAAIKKARKDFYVSLFGLGQVATFVKDDAAGEQLESQRRSLAKLAARLAADPKRLEALKTNAARWWAFAKRTTPGIVLAGAVENVEPAGKLFHAKIRIGEAADAPVVTVVSPHDPQLDPGDQVVAMGCIFAHPEQELSGYDGTDTAVVWSGMTVKVLADAK